MLQRSQTKLIVLLVALGVGTPAGQDQCIGNECNGNEDPLLLQVALEGVPVKLHQQESSVSTAGDVCFGKDLSVRTLRVADHGTIKANMPDCNFYEEEDLYKKVPDKCCNPSAWPAGSGVSLGEKDDRTTEEEDGKEYSCYARERVPAPGEYIRSYLGCEDGKLKYAEECAPAGTSFGHGYPMNESVAKASFVDGDSHSCGCAQPGYTGEGCYVAFTGYMAGFGGTGASFLLLEGDCSGCA